LEPLAKRVNKYEGFSKNEIGLMEIGGVDPDQDPWPRAIEIKRTFKKINGLRYALLIFMLRALQLVLL